MYLSPMNHMYRLSGFESFHYCLYRILFLFHLFNCVTGTYSMLMKVAFPSTIELKTFIGRLQKFGKTQTQIVFSTPVQPRGLNKEGTYEKIY